MTEKSRIDRLDRMEQHQDLMSNKVDDIDKKVTQIYKSIVGDKAMGNIGMAERLLELEANMSDTTKELRSLRDEKVRNDVYIKIMIFFSSAIAGGLIISLFRGWIKFV